MATDPQRGASATHLDAPARYLSHQRQGAGRPRAFWGPYGASKAALDNLVRTWADELENTPVRTVLLDPGVMRTRMRAEAMPGEDQTTLPDPVEIGPLIVELAQADLGLPTANVAFEDWKTAGTLASA